jgi:CubicO group peptidase (beta-lactamase class C family)
MPLSTAGKAQVDVDDGEQVSAISPTIEELNGKLETILKDNAIPGAAAALVTREKILWIGTFGVADMDSHRSVTEDTHFCIGSCTKSFVGLAFLKLLQDGRIDFNVPVNTIAPEIEIDNPWHESHPVRIIHLLEHTAGFDDLRPNWFYFEGPVKPLAQALEEKADLRKVRWKPGTRYSYSSAGYTLAGYVMGKISGKPYEEYLTQEIFRPLGMESATIGRENERNDLLSVGYERDMKPVPFYISYDEPSGDLNASIREMALFVRFMLNGGKTGKAQVISSELIDRVGKSTTTIAAQAGLDIGYSFGIGASVRDNQVWYGHSGAVPGFYADYSYNNEYGVGYVFLCNRFAPIEYDQVIDELRHFFVPGMEAAPLLPVQISETQCNSYCGYYEKKNPRMQLVAFVEKLIGGTTIRCVNDTLYQQDFRSEKAALIPVTKNLFRNRDHPVASRVFTETPDGVMVYATKGSYFEKSRLWKAVLCRLCVFGALAIMASSIAYALIWIPVHLYKRVRHIDRRSRYLRVRILPLLAVLSLVLGPLLIADQTILEFGTMTFRNIVFFLSTLFFAGFSILSVLVSLRSFAMKIGMFDRIYGLLVSAACLGMALYLGYWGIIGLRLWTY